MHFLRYILFCIFIGLSFIGISKEIIIDNFFKTEDVYNSLLTTEDDLQSDYITYKAILYNTTSNSKKLAISVINPIIDTIELIKTTPCTSRSQSFEKFTYHNIIHGI